MPKKLPTKWPASKRYHEHVAWVIIVREGINCIDCGSPNGLPRLLGIFLDNDTAERALACERMVCTDGNEGIAELRGTTIVLAPAGRLYARDTFGCDWTDAEHLLFRDLDAYAKHFLNERLPAGVREVVTRMKS